MDNVTNFPLWKQNCTSIEKLREVLQYAESHPEELNDLIVLWNDESGVRRMECDGQLRVDKSVFMLEMAKLDMLRNM